MRCAGPLALSVLATCAIAATAAEVYPTRPIRLIVGYPPGGSTDIAARLIALKLAPVFGQTVVVDNRSGASGTIGAGLVVKSEPDGHTLSFAASPEVAIYRALMKNPPYDSLKDFQAITLVGRVPFMLVVHPSVAAASVKELVTLAKAKPGSLNFASFGNGTSNHLVAEAFCAATGARIVHIPYKGSAPAIADLLGGQVQMTFDTIPVVLPQVRAGKLKALAVATPRRSPLAPEVPTMDEAGVTGFTGGTWFGVLAPARTPSSVVERLNRETNAAFADAAMKARFAAISGEPIAGTPAQFAKLIADETEKWAKVVKFAGLKVE